MLRFIVDVECENDAIADNNEELGRIITHVAAKVYDGQTSGVLRDSNGNRVGCFSFTDGDLPSVP